MMKDLKIGDEIAVGKDGVYEAIYSFGHYEPQGSAIILEIETSRHPTLLVSHQHLVFVETKGVVGVVRASSVSVGDSLVAIDSDDKSGEMIVKSVAPVFSSDGLYAPFTASGKLLVNDGLLVSSFVALNNEEVVSVFGVNFSHQWLAHSFEGPHRLICSYYTKWCAEETYTRAGIFMWEAYPMEAALWWCNMESIIWKNTLFVAFLLLLLCFNAMERVMLFRHYVLIVTAGFLLLKRPRRGKAASY